MNRMPSFWEKIIQLIHFWNIREYIIKNYIRLNFKLPIIILYQLYYLYYKKSIDIESINFSMYYTLYTL